MSDKGKTALIVLALFLIALIIVLAFVDLSQINIGSPGEQR